MILSYFKCSFSSLKDAMQYFSSLKLTLPRSHNVWLVWLWISHAFCNKYSTNRNLRWGIMGRYLFKQGKLISNLSQFWTLLKMKSFRKHCLIKFYFELKSDRLRDQNIPLIGNTYESWAPLFKTDEKIRVWRKNPHEFMHQSCHTSGSGTMMCGLFSPTWNMGSLGAR